MKEESGQRPTDAPFGAEEADRIMKAVEEERTLACPRCGGDLQMGPPADPTISQFTVFLVRCPNCRRAVFHGMYRKKKR